MPGCYYRVHGTHFDPDAFLASATLEAYKVYHAGEPMGRSGRRAAMTHEVSGFNCNVSDVDGILADELTDAIVFLQTNHSDLLRLATDPHVDERFLDFGFYSRLYGDKDIAMQGEFLSIEFLELVAELKIGVQLSYYT